MDIFKLFCKETIDDEIIQIVKDKLLLKYNEEFEVYKIGRRYGTAEEDTVTTICRNIHNKDCLFEAVLNADRVQFHDDYYKRLICYELKKEMIDIFQENNMEVYPRIDIIHLQEFDQKMSLNDFIEKKSEKNFFIQLYINGNVKYKEIKKAIDSIKEKHSKINMRGNILLLDSKDYEEYMAILKELPDNEDHYIEENAVIEKYRIERI